MFWGVYEFLGLSWGWYFVFVNVDVFGWWFIDRILYSKGFGGNGDYSFDLEFVLIL